MKVISNSAAGDAFLQGMANTEKEWAKGRENFTHFIENLGFAAWHIHDGWLTDGIKSGNFDKRGPVELTWIHAHSGYSHSKICPIKGHRMIIVDKSPTGQLDGIFTMYCYEVVARQNSLGGTPHLNLEYLKTIKAVVNNITRNYEECKEPPKESFWKTLRNLLFSPTP